MPTYTDEAVVLRTTKLGEADRIITLLSRDHGKVRAVAKGVRRTSSSFGARLEPFSHIDLQLVEGRSLDIVRQAVTRDAFGQLLLTDYPRFTAGEVMVETADRLVAEEHEPSRQQFHLLVGALRALVEGTTDGPRPGAMVLDAYLVRALATAGYAPVLSECARCGDPGPHVYFNPAVGGTVCRACRPPGSGLVTPGTLAYLTALLTGDWRSTRDVPVSSQRETSGIVTAFVGWQLDHGLRSLAHVER